MSAGKGDKPRNCFSKKYKENYEDINWEECQKILQNKTCPKCNNEVRFNFKACRTCGYVFK